MNKKQSQTLLILPGLDGTEVFFRPFLALLPPHIRPVVICYPPESRDGYEGLLALVRRSIADLPECFVLGASFGGPLAVMLAAAEPEKVKGLILSATFVTCPRPQFVRYRFAAVAPVVWMLRAARRLPVWLGRKRDDPFRRAKAETWSTVSAGGLAARLRAVLTVDVRDSLRRCAMPVMCVVFSDDRVVPRSATESAIQCQPKTTLARVEGGHFAFYTNAALYAEVIVRFINAEAFGNSDRSAGTVRA